MLTCNTYSSHEDLPPFCSWNHEFNSSLENENMGGKMLLGNVAPNCKQTHLAWMRLSSFWLFWDVWGYMSSGTLRYWARTNHRYQSCSSYGTHGGRTTTSTCSSSSLNTGEPVQAQLKSKIKSLKLQNVDLFGLSTATTEQLQQPQRVKILRSFAHRAALCRQSSY